MIENLSSRQNKNPCYLYRNAVEITCDNCFFRYHCSFKYRRGYTPPYDFSNEKEKNEE